MLSGTYKYVGVLNVNETFTGMCQMQMGSADILFSFYNFGNNIF